MTKKTNSNSSNLIQSLLEELKKEAEHNPQSANLLRRAEKKVEQGLSEDEVFDSETIYFLTTLRNRNLIQESEQQSIQKTSVAVFGLSVGSHVVAAWSMFRPNSVKIADHDVISISNLNRIRATIVDVGRPKADVAEEAILAASPATKVQKLMKTDTEHALQFLDLLPKAQIIVDEVDNMGMKIFLRKYCKQHKIPLVSACDVGQMVILDVERHDLDPKLEPFLGKISKDEIDNFEQLDEREKKMLIVKLVGLEMNDPEMLESIIDFMSGKISTWPQLGATAQMAGGIVVNTIQSIIRKKKIESGRYYFSVSATIDAEYNDKKSIAYRDKLSQQIQEKLGV